MTNGTSKRENEKVQNPFGKKARSKPSQDGVIPIDVFQGPLLEAMPEAVLVLDRDGKIQFFNKSAEKLMGYSASEVLGQSIVFLLPKPYNKEDDHALSDLLRRECLWMGVQTTELVVQQKDSTLLPVEASLSVVKAAGTELFCCTFKSLLSRQRAKELGQEGEFITAVLDTSGALVMVVDNNDKLIYLNRACQTSTGFDFDEVYNQNLLEVFKEPSEEAVVLNGLDLVRRNGGISRFEATWVTKSGDRRRVTWNASLMTDNAGQINFTILTGIDITQRLRVEEALRQSEERYALAAKGANDGLFDWNLLTNEVFYSHRWKTILGEQDDTVDHTPQAWLDRVHPEDRQSFQQVLSAHLAGHTEHFEHEHRLRHKDGGYRWILCRAIAVKDSQATPVRMAGSGTDITMRKEAEQEIIHGALHDRMTGLANWALFVDRLGQALWRSKRSGGNSFAVLFIDIDNFKLFNDSLGYHQGDVLLRTIAQRLVECVRPGDTVGRFSGDEFTVLLEGLLDQEEAIRLATRIQEAVSSPFHLGELEVYVSASIGVALSRHGYDRPEEILRDADMAMYKAKTMGMGHLAVFDDKMHSNALDQVKLRTDLKYAFDRGEFILYYQPILSLGTGKIAGFEALVRWQHPKKGLVLPGEFIATIEESRLIHELGQWVMAEGVSQLRKWKEKFDMDELYMTVNVSPMQFKQFDLVKRVGDLVKLHQVKSGELHLELTESAMIENSENALQTMNSLKEMGLSLILDDFGTGYSSLSYLHQFPLDSLKIDRSFIERMGSGKGYTGIAETIILLAEKLNMTVVAEGVELEEQLDRLKTLGCGFVQGYFFARPMPPNEVETFIAKQLAN